MTLYAFPEELHLLENLPYEHFLITENDEPAVIPPTENVQIKPEPSHIIRSELTKNIIHY